MNMMCVEMCSSMCWYMCKLVSTCWIRLCIVEESLTAPVEVYVPTQPLPSSETCARSLHSMSLDFLVFKIRWELKHLSLCNICNETTAVSVRT